MKLVLPDIELPERGVYKPQLSTNNHKVSERHARELRWNTHKGTVFDRQKKKPAEK